MQQAAPATPPFRPLSLSIESPDSKPVLLGPQEKPIAIAPDGAFVVFTAPAGPGGRVDEATLLVDRFDGHLATPLLPAGTRFDPRSPFVSPDGQWVGFFSNGAIVKIPAGGGTPIVICECMASSSGGGAWMPDGSIVFAFGNRLRMVAADGRARRDLTLVNARAGERAHLGPSVVGDGRHVIFTVIRAQLDDATVEAVDVVTGKRSMIRGGVFGKYLSPGQVVWLDTDGRIHVVRLDPETVRTFGPDVVLPVDPVEYAQEGGAAFDAALNGTLVFAPATSNADPAPGRLLAWVTRDGKEERAAVPPRAYAYPRIAPGGNAVALDVRDQAFRIWLWDLQRSTLDVLTTLDRSVYPAWAPDGRSLLFSSDYNGVGAVFRVDVDRPRDVAVFAAGASGLLPYAISPDGAFAILREMRDGQTRLVVASMATPGAVRPVTPFARAILNAEISPDGRWLAFQAGESGPHDIYLQAFPDPGERRIRVSTGGGLTPLWTRGGRELLYMDLSRELQVVSVDTTPEGPKVGVPARFFPPSYSSRSWYQEPVGRTFDVTPDGSRFLVVREPATPAARRHAALRVVLGAVKLPALNVRERIQLMLGAF